MALMIPTQLKLSKFSSINSDYSIHSLKKRYILAASRKG